MYKESLLAGALLRADFCAFALDARGPAACFLARATGSLTAEAHFLTTGAFPWLEEAGRLAIAECEKQFACLFCSIPLQWRGARALAMRLGFAQAAIFPGNCWLAGRKRFVDCALLLKKADACPLAGPGARAGL